MKASPSIEATVALLAAMLVAIVGVDAAAFTTYNVMDFENEAADATEAMFGALDDLMASTKPLADVVDKTKSLISAASMAKKAAIATKESAAGVYIAIEATMAANDAAKVVYAVAHAINVATNAINIATCAINVASGAATDAALAAVAALEKALAAPKTANPTAGAPVQDPPVDEGQQ